MCVCLRGSLIDRCRAFSSFHGTYHHTHTQTHSYFANLALEVPKWPISAIRTALKLLTRKDLQAFAAPEMLLDEGYGTALLQVCGLDWSTHDGV